MISHFMTLVTLSIIKGKKVRGSNFIFDVALF
jgi:hypothetical protein